MALLMLGSNRHKMSRSNYETQRGILKIRDLILPEWEVARQIRERLKLRFGLKVVQRLSPLGNPCFSLRVQDVIAQVSGVSPVWDIPGVLLLETV